MTTHNPWLRIPVRAYEGHMAEIGQSAALRDVFARLYAERRPRRLLVLGCTTGSDFEIVDPAVTAKCVGVDLNADYLATARAKLPHLSGNVELLHGDVLEVALPCCEFDLIHAALILEYVDPAALLPRVAKWLAPGGVCATVTQNPVVGVAPVSETPYESLKLLDGHMALLESGCLSALARMAGLERVSQWDVELPLGKSFSVSTFTVTNHAHSK